MQYLAIISKMTEWSSFISKADHSTSWESKSMLQVLKLKKLKLTGSMKTTRPSKLRAKKDILFITGDWYAKVGSQSRDTWSNRQVWPWSTKWSRAKASRVLSRERAGHSKHPLPTTQKKTLHMIITRWSTPKSDWLYSLQPKMEKLYNQQKQDQELTVAQIMSF